MARIGAPYGERHGKGSRYPDWLVKAVRMEHYDYGEPVAEISRILAIPEETIRDWVSFKTRVHGVYEERQQAQAGRE